MGAIILISPLERNWNIDLVSESFGTCVDRKIAAT